MCWRNEMRDKQVIMFEGIPGSGKTTTAKQLYKYLRENGINTRAYFEGETPIDLLWHACFTENEYKDLCERFSVHAEQIKRCALIENNYIFVKYRAMEENYFDGELLEKLKEKDFFFGAKPAVSSAEFTEILKSKWKKVAEDFADNDDKAIIIDAAVFQHQVHDLQRLYNMNDDGIINHISVLIEQLANFQPTLIYLTQSDLAKNLKRIAVERNSLKYGTDERINYYKNRKQVDFEAMSRLNLRSYVIDNSDCDYDKVFKMIKIIIDI
jgi:thymidylate kinase